jgi:hypothetical protein
MEANDDKEREEKYGEEEGMIKEGADEEKEE